MEEKSPKLPHNHETVGTSSNEDPMRVRALTTTPVSKNSTDMTSSPNATLERKRLHSDSVLCKFAGVTMFRLLPIYCYYI